jgi:hypothetical protein
MRTRRTVRLLLTLAFVAVGIWLVGSKPSADSTGINFSYQEDGSPWAAGPDFATDVMGDPWDFKNIDDTDRYPNSTIGWSNFAVDTSAGTAGGNTAFYPGSTVHVNTMGFHYPGFYNAINPGRSGRRFPVTTSRYRKIAFKLNSSITDGVLQLRWLRYAFGEPGSDLIGGPQGPVQSSTIVSGDQIYVLDLGANSTYTANTIVRGFRVDRNGASNFATLQYDWIRLTTPDNASDAALQTFTWSGASGQLDVYNASGTTRLFTISTNASSGIQWNYGVLAPGSYRVRLTRTGLPTLERAFIVNQPPMVAMSKPDETGDEDYATTVLGNPWDMDSLSDITITGTENTTYLTISNGSQLEGQNIAGNDGPNIFLLHAPNATPLPIDTSRYRFFTITYQVDGAFDLGAGSVARILWGSSQFFDAATATTSKSWLTWTGMNSYTIDLASLVASSDDGIETLGATEPWTANAKRHFNFHPHEFGLTPSDNQRVFRVENVKLAAMAQTSGGVYLLTWNRLAQIGIADDGTPATTVNLYYDTDRDPASKSTIVTGLNPAVGVYSWNALPQAGAGTYWIYVEATDGIQTWGQYSTGQVRVLGTESTTPVVTIDTPTNNSTVIQPLTVRGCAIDAGASFGNGMDLVQISAQPSGGAETVLGNATLNVLRGDNCGQSNTQFANSGFTYTVTGLSPGSYTLFVRARSTVSGTFTTRTIAITLPTSNPAMSLDDPTDESTVGSNFTMSGWAVDLAAPASAGVGVDYVHIYAYPISGYNGGVTGAGIYLGQHVVSIQRNDIAAVFGSQFRNSGYSANISTLSPGIYRMYVYGHSLVAGTFNNFSTPVDITVGSTASNPTMYIDSPQVGATLTAGVPFTISGWGIDRGSTSGTGVGNSGAIPIHVWGVLASGGPFFFITAGGASNPRPDIGAVFGSRFTNSGFSISGEIGNPGVYDIYVFTFCDLIGPSQPCQARVNRVTVN